MRNRQGKPTVDDAIFHAAWGHAWRERLQEDITRDEWISGRDAFVRAVCVTRATLDGISKVMCSVLHKECNNTVTAKIEAEPNGD